MEKQLTYNESEVLEIIRYVLFYGEPEYYEKGGLHGNINFPPNGTYKKAKHCYEKYFLKTSETQAH
jgi:hypothetical protein